MEEWLKNILREGLKEKFKIDNSEFIIEHPRDMSHGDYATNIALVVAKQLGKSPAEVAKELVEYLVQKNENLIKSVSVAGPGFINISLSELFFADVIQRIVTEGETIRSTQVYKDQRWAVEYASPNPNKAMHLGHLRNVLTGIAVTNILEANGATVIREMIDNNRGIAIAKLMWGYLVGAHKESKRIEDVGYWVEHQQEWLSPEDTGKSPDQFVDEWYVLGAKEAEENIQEDKIRNLVIQWEAKNEVVWKLWEKVLTYSYEGQRRTLTRLGATFDIVWHEHEHYEEGKNYVQKGLENNIFKKLDDGAVLTDLSSYNLPDTILQKRDGTALYITQDIALTTLKKEKHGADKLIWIIGPEQSLAMQQLFAVCEQLGIGKRDEFIHLSYGYMSIKGQGKMSSRKGNVIYIDTVLDEAKADVKELIKDWIIEEKQEEVSEIVAHSAVAFSILKAGRTTDTAFDFATAIKLEGDTGPYVQYTAVRAQSVLKKALSLSIKSDVALPAGWQTTELERLLSSFPGIVTRAGIEFAPNYIAEYLLALASAFNNFYGVHTIADTEDIASGYKVALTTAAHQVLVRGLRLLGIKVPDQM